MKRTKATYTNPVVLFFKVLRRAFQHLVDNDPLRMAGATAFFTSFALPFLLMIIVRTISFFYNPALVRSEVFSTLSDVLGRGTMQQVVDVLVAFRNLASNGWITAGGILFLFLVSTTLLMIMRTSMNQLWDIRVPKTRVVRTGLLGRLRSIAIIFATGFLFFLSILAEGVRTQFDLLVVKLLPQAAGFFTGAVNYLFSLLFVALWFALILRYLPDARAHWRITFAGALLTSVLFNLGKYLLRILLLNSDVGSLYGASASIVLLLLFVFYSSLILYFGVAFTYTWAREKGMPIKPLHHARHYTVTDVPEETGYK